MPRSTCEVNAAFIDRVVTGRMLLPHVVAEVMKEIAEEVFVPIMKDAAPWLADGEEGPPGEDRKTWIVTGMSRDFVAYVPGYIEPVLHFSSFTDQFKHHHDVNMQLLSDAAEGAGESAVSGQVVRLVVARYADYTPYLQAMERGEIKGFGRGEGPPDAWDRMSAGPVEEIVFQEHTAQFWLMVMARLRERMIQYTGARGGWIW